MEENKNQETKEIKEKEIIGQKCNAIGHIGNFYYELESYNIKEKVFLVICTSAARLGLHYHTKVQLGENAFINLFICPYKNYVSVYYSLIINGFDLNQVGNWMTLKSALKIWPDMPKFEWKSRGVMEGYEGTLGAGNEPTITDDGKIIRD